MAAPVCEGFVSPTLEPPTLAPREPNPSSKMRPITSNSECPGYIKEDLLRFYRQLFVTRSSR